MFASCSGVLEDSSGIFKHNTQIEQYQCCIDQCKPSNEYCNNQCDQRVDELFASELAMGTMTLEEALSTCKLRCTETYNTCENTCRLVSPMFDIGNTYYKCATALCPPEINLEPPPECVGKNRKDIYDCCISKCTPQDNLSCDKFCKFQEGRALDRILPRAVQGKGDDPHKTRTGIIVAVVVVGALIIIPLMIKSILMGLLALTLIFIILYKIK